MDPSYSLNSYNNNNILSPLAAMLTKSLNDDEEDIFEWMYKAIEKQTALLEGIGNIVK